MSPIDSVYLYCVGSGKATARDISFQVMSDVTATKYLLLEQYANQRPYKSLASGGSSLDRAKSMWL